jgi:hypothetical protein
MAKRYFGLFSQAKGQIDPSSLSVAMHISVAVVALHPGLTIGARRPER